MRTILAGSSAIKYHFPDFPREPKDIDYIVDEPNLLSSSKEIEYLYNPIIMRHIHSDILSPSELLTLKVSHITYDINWEKHMWDIHWLKRKGICINHVLYDKLVYFWKTSGILGKTRRSNLNMTKEEFFTNKVNPTINSHDELHEIINPNPIYKTVLKDGCEVELDSKKWVGLSLEDKYKLIREEVYVMAYERYKDKPYIVAYRTMLKKFILSHCPEFMLRFTVYNYYNLINPEYNFINKINNELQRNNSSIETIGN